MSKRKGLLVVLVLVLMGLSIVNSAIAQPSDIKGHWAEPVLSTWVEQGLIAGYDDGSLRPNQGITRAEFATLVNRTCQFTSRSNPSFSDVKPGDWFYEEVARAVAAGYISGYEDKTFKPGSQITRQEVAIAVFAIAKLPSTEMNSSVSFKDAASIPQWSKNAICQVVGKGYMKGYPDGTFQPTRSISRAEAVIVLNYFVSGNEKGRVVTNVPNSAMETVAGDKVISAPGATLENTVINGDLILSKEIGEGNVTLKNVTVNGTTRIKGGGAHSITMDNCSLSDIVISKDGVRVVASGNTSVKLTTLESGATLVELNLTGTGFEAIKVLKEVPKGSSISLSGSFTEVTINAINVKVEVAKGASVATLNLGAAVTVKGTGKIKHAVVNVTGSTIEQKPEKLTIASNVTVTVNGQLLPNAVVAGGGGGGGSAAPQAPALAKVTNVRLSNTGVATWDNVSNESGFTVQLYHDGAVCGAAVNLAADTLTYDFLSAMRAAGAGVYTVRVTATGDAVNYSNGPQSDASAGQTVIALNTVTGINMVWNGDEAHWTGVADAVSYDVQLYKDGAAVISPVTVAAGAGGVDHLYDFSAAITSEGLGTYTYTVIAKGNNTLILDAPPSAISDANIKAAQPLDAVTNLQWTTPTGTLSWDNVIHNSGYCYYMYKGPSIIASGTILQDTCSKDFLAIMRGYGAGSYSVQVSALGDGTNYTGGPLTDSSALTVIALNSVTAGLNWNGNEAHWTGVNNAVSYDVQLYKAGTALGAAVNVAAAAGGIDHLYDFTAVITSEGLGTYYYTVTAKGDAGLILDGAPSNQSPDNTVSVLPLAQITNLQWDNLHPGTVSWDNVAHESGYGLFLFKNYALVGGELDLPADACSMDYLNTIRPNGPGGYSVQVYAIGDGVSYVSGTSSYSSIEYVIAPQTVSAGLNWAGDVAHWTGVADAVSYDVQLYKDGTALDSPVNVSAGGGGAGTDYTNDFSAAITAAGTGTYTYKVTAKGDGGWILDGGTSPASDNNVKS